MMAKSISYLSGSPMNTNKYVIFYSSYRLALLKTQCDIFDIFQELSFQALVLADWSS